MNESKNNKKIDDNKLVGYFEILEKRIKDSENIRLLAEDARKKAEEARCIAEEARDKAESIRQEIYDRLKRIFSDL